MYFSAFRDYSRCCCGAFPLAPHRGHVLIVVRQKFLRQKTFNCLQADTRCLRSRSRNRYSSSHTTHRHSHSHCCSTDRPHGPTWEFCLIFIILFFILGGGSNKMFALAPRISLAYATICIALNADTDVANLILPLKASRHPMLAYTFSESLLEYAYDTPPLALA